MENTKLFVCRYDIEASLIECIVTKYNEEHEIMTLESIEEFPERFYISVGITKIRTTPKMSIYKFHLYKDQIDNFYWANTHRIEDKGTPFSSKEKHKEFLINIFKYKILCAESEMKKYTDKLNKLI